MADTRTPYPVRVDGASNPDAVSRALWLVTWLLLIPHLVVLLFLWLAFYAVGIVAYFAILITGRYPRPLYDFILGMDRWALRVAAYAALMTDRYPPFRLDQGGSDPGSAPAVPAPPAPSGVPGGPAPITPAPVAPTPAG